MAKASFGERIRIALEALRGRLPEAAPVEIQGGPASTEAPAAPRADGEVDELARALIACFDLLDAEEEATEKARLALERAGIESFGAEGERFDRARHRAQGRVETHDSALDWTIATCVAPGWVRGESVLRLADVWVYRLEADLTPSEG